MRSLPNSARTGATQARTVKRPVSQLVWASRSHFGSKSQRTVDLLRDCFLENHVLNDVSETARHWDAIIFETYTCLR